MLLPEKLENYNVVLVSKSPRRRELLKGLEIDFDCTSVESDERYPEWLQGAQIPTYIAEQKADAFMPQMTDTTLAITADTVVLVNDKVLCKPADKSEAEQMLQIISNNSHKVITGVCIFTKNKRRTFHALSEVTFTALSMEEIEHYVTKYKPFDKAGSYGIQEWIGFIGMEKIVGSYYNVMGLPVQRLYKELNTFLG